LQTANVSIFSVCSCLGRLVTGVCSDWLLHAHAVPRVGFFLFGSVVVREMDRAPFSGSFSDILQANDRLLYQDRLGTITREIVFKGGSFSQMMLSMLMLALGVWQTPSYVLHLCIDCFSIVF
jgi:hypothetical protein